MILSVKIRYRSFLLSLKDFMFSISESRSDETPFDSVTSTRVFRSTPILKEELVCL